MVDIVAIKICAGITQICSIGEVGKERHLDRNLVLSECRWIMQMTIRAAFEVKKGGFVSIHKAMNRRVARTMLSGELIGNNKSGCTERLK